MVTADFSRIARAYRWMEYLSFGRLLETARFYRLSEVQTCRRALLLGDGDGRFLQRLLHENPHIAVDAIDCSSGMIELAKKRVARESAVARVRWFHDDTLTWQPNGKYDLVSTHFVLVCFSTEQVASMVARLEPHLDPGGCWINSDFTLPSNGWARYAALAIVRGLYAAFFVLTGLRTQQLPQDEAAFRGAGLVLEKRSLLCGGLLKSELWRKISA